MESTWLWKWFWYPRKLHRFNCKKSILIKSSSPIFGIFWISGMHFHGAYLSNYDIWLKDPKSITPSSHSLYSLIGQDILNSYTSQYFSGITITSGFYQLWRSSGIITQSQLKYACAACLIATLICLSGSYLHMQLMSKFTSFIRFKSLSQDHLIRFRYLHSTHKLLHLTMHQ